MANQREKKVLAKPDWLYSKCTITRYFKNWESERTEGSVRLLKGAIYVTYQDLEVERENSNLADHLQKESWVYLQGVENGSGHYVLKCPRVEATLHRFESSQFFEGFIKDDKSTGMWRIATNSEGEHF